jgi:hypothetical protein
MNTHSSMYSASARAKCAPRPYGGASMSLVMGDDFTESTADFGIRTTARQHGKKIRLTAIYSSAQYKRLRPMTIGNSRMASQGIRASPATMAMPECGVSSRTTRSSISIPWLLLQASRVATFEGICERWRNARRPIESNRVEFRFGSPRDSSVYLALVTEINMSQYATTYCKTAAIDSE